MHPFSVADCLEIPTSARSAATAPTPACSSSVSPLAAGSPLAEAPAPDGLTRNDQDPRLLLPASLGQPGELGPWAGTYCAQAIKSILRPHLLAHPCTSTTLGQSHANIPIQSTHGPVWGRLSITGPQPSPSQLSPDRPVAIDSNLNRNQIEFPAPLLNLADHDTNHGIVSRRLVFLSTAKVSLVYPFIPSLLTITRVVLTLPFLLYLSLPVCNAPSGLHNDGA